jgi:CheY-like chemotaxis protein
MASGVGPGSWSILVVDDEENLNWSLVNSLRKEGYTADGALSGEEALRRLTATPYNCVISDVKMPGMDGFELLQWLRQHRPRTRVIMMTAFGSPTARQEAMRGGVIAYLEKPFDLAALKEELRRLVPSESDTATGQAETESYDLLEVSRVLNLTRRDIAIAVQAGGIHGTLRFLRGELIWAQAGALHGEDAFLALCASRGAGLQPEAWDGRSDRNVTQSLSQLIYAALARRQGGSAPLIPPTAAHDAQEPSPSRPSQPSPHPTGGRASRRRAPRSRPGSMRSLPPTRPSIRATS